jgi:large subunit ribosomal protein L22
MGKQSTSRVLADTEAKSVSRNLRVSPQKLNLVAKMIRGMPVGRADSALQFSKRRIANDVRKVLLSAIANAENNHQLDVDQLIVKEAWVGKAMTLKRYRPRARGRMGKIFKHFSRLTIVLKQQNYSGDISPMEAARQAGEMAVVSQEEQAEIDAKAIDEAVGAENEAAVEETAEAKE